MRDAPAAAAPARAGRQDTQDQHRAARRRRHARPLRRSRRASGALVLSVSNPVLTAPVSAVPALFATVRARPGPLRPVKTASSVAGGVFVTGRNGPGCARTVGNRAGTALAVR